MGQAAGSAAALSVSAGSDLGALDVGELRERLVSNGVVL
jgi:hypothetical protein